MNFKVKEIEFEMLNEFFVPVETSDEELKRIQDYISKTVWKAPTFQDLPEVIENALNCKVLYLKCYDPPGLTD